MGPVRGVDIRVLLGIGGALLAMAVVPWLRQTYLAHRDGFAVPYAPLGRLF